MFSLVIKQSPVFSVAPAVGAAAASSGTRRLSMCAPARGGAERRP